MRTTNKWLLATSVFALSAAGLAHAQDNDENDETLRQQTVTVTGRRLRARRKMRRCRSMFCQRASCSLKARRRLQS